MSKEITKEVYEKAACWMAAFEDPTLLMESMPKKDVDPFLLDAAFEILYEVYQIYNDE